MKDSLEIFVERLASAELLVNVCNHYSYEKLDNLIRRNNLLLYLRQMRMLNPNIMFVGEAPGYHGCRLTGVPFTSEYILLKGIRELGIFGIDAGYKKTDELPIVKKEQTATIIWETLIKHKITPLLWNAFPFHPYHEGNSSKNRNPSMSELVIGQEYLHEIIEIYGINTIVAVGNNAEISLHRLNMKCKKVRHPANGGKPDFVAGINEILEMA